MDGLLKNTNDSRESSSIYISLNLISKGYKLYIYDPKVSDKKITTDLKDNEHLIKAKHNLENKFVVCRSIDECIKNSDLILFLQSGRNLLKLRQKRKIIDTRNIVENEVYLNYNLSVNDFN